MTKRFLIINLGITCFAFIISILIGLIVLIDDQKVFLPVILVLNVFPVWGILISISYFIYILFIPNEFTKNWGFVMLSCLFGLAAYAFNLFPKQLIFVFFSPLITAGLWFSLKWYGRDRDH